MSVKTQIHRAIAPFLRRFGAEVVPTYLVYDWQKSPVRESAFNPTTLPIGANEYLRLDNPRLSDLKKRYAVCPPQVTTSVLWDEHYIQAEHLKFFRGDNPYVWQLRGCNNNAMGYAVAFYYLLSIDYLGLLDRLEEDAAFGNFSFVIQGKQVSRDLLDSINELYFLERHVDLSTIKDCSVLDIGAGYGRLAHRMLRALPNVSAYYCTDAVPSSTFISEYYLRYRGLQDRAHVIPLDQIEKTLQERLVHLAVNIHSFSECSLPAIDWWVSLLARSKIRFLMIVPNSIDPSSGELLLTNEGQQIAPVIVRHGYELVISEPKYRDPIVQEYALSPTFYHLFELVRPPQ